MESSSYRDIVGHPTVRAMAIASNLDSQPDCVNCAYKPYCGTQPDPQPQDAGHHLRPHARESNMCAVHKGIQDYLFEKLAEGDPETLEILDRWTTNRSREHFLHSPEGG